MISKNKQYHVREFADMAGVTVRTLQYYDRIGVLEPSDKTSKKHRLYERKDLLKLQQVLTLKQLGFTLQEIKDMIHHPEYDLQSALSAQKQAVDEQIKQLQQVSSAMEEALRLLDTHEEWDWDNIQIIIQGMTDKRYLEWIRKHYSDEQLITLAQQSQDVPLTQIRDAYTKWQTIADTLRLNQHLSPEHPTLQNLAQEADDLIQAFTQGNPEIKDALAKMYEQPDDIPPAYKVFDDDLIPFYRQVMDMYYQSKDND